MDWLYTLSGFAVGAIVGLTGVGGGSLMTPLLVLVFGVAPVTAVGTDLLFAALTKTGGAWAHARRGNVDWKIVGRLAAGSVPASAVTLLLLHLFVPDHGKLSAIVSVALGVALILTAGALLFREKLHHRAAHDDRRGDSRRAGHRVLGGCGCARGHGAFLPLSGPRSRAHRRRRHRPCRAVDARRWTRPRGGRRRRLATSRRPSHRLAARNLARQRAQPEDPGTAAAHRTRRDVDLDRRQARPLDADVSLRRNRPEAR